VNLHPADGWCRLPAAGRAACWCAALLLTLLAAGSPFRGEPPPVGGADFTPQWRRLLALSRQSEPLALPDAAPFSALNLQAAGVTLVSWQPDGKSGELLLESDWRSIPPLFALLARSGAAIPAFSIAPQDGALAVSLRLEMDDEG